MLAITATGLIAASRAQPDVKERLANLGAETVSMGPAPFSSFVRSEVMKWSKVVKDAGIKPE